MTILTPTVGENKLLEFMLGFATPGNQTLKLFVSNTTPADGDTAASYTEMTTQGYVAKTLTKASWSIAQNAGLAEGSYAEQTFTFDGTGGDTTVYGYFVVDSTTGVLLWAERFAVAKLVRYNGDQILVTPKYTFEKKV